MLNMGDPKTGGYSIFWSLVKRVELHLVTETWTRNHTASPVASQFNSKNCLDYERVCILVSLPVSWPAAFQARPSDHSYILLLSPYSDRTAGRSATGLCFLFDPSVLKNKHHTTYLFGKRAFSLTVRPRYEKRPDKKILALVKRGSLEKKVLWFWWEIAGDWKMTRYLFDLFSLVLYSFSNH